MPQDSALIKDSLERGLSALFIAQFTGIPLTKEMEQFTVASGIAFHTGRLKSGEAFFALPGEAMHGLKFADTALAKGASFIVSDKPHPKGIVVPNPTEVLLNLGRWARKQITGSVIAITGSAGKTSTKTFVAAALQARATEGNLNTPLALAKTMIKHAIHSPNEPLILELGIDHIGEMDTLVELVQPTHGIVTSIGASHLEQLKSIDTVAQEKFKLFSKGAQAYVSEQASSYAKKQLTNFHIYSTQNPDVALTNSSLSYKGISVQLSRPGKLMASNMLIALELADRFGIPLTEVKNRLEQVEFETGRLEFKHFGNLTVIDDSYNSNPLSAEESLGLLKREAAPHVAILGDMLELGRESYQYHKSLGKLTRNISTYAIGRQSIALLESNPQAEHYLTPEGFLAQLPQFTEGTVLVKGSRGMKLERVVEAIAEQARASESKGAV